MVQSISGHRTLSELQKYLHITADRQRLIADAYASGWLAATPPASPIIAAVDGATQSVVRARGA